ncbi:MAG TPA: hypothetical protein ENJ82_00870, partial [Bacteroidetes bacterium]|nr:hypothetical protein [Bacteroidota bacterium]
MSKSLLSLAVTLVFFSGQVWGQSSIWLRNDSRLILDVQLVHSGSLVPDSSKWNQLAGRQVNWQVDQEIYAIERDSATVPIGDSVISTLLLIANGDTAQLKLKLTGVNGGTELLYSVALPGQADVWQADGAFHEIQGIFAGKTVRLKYRPDADDANQDRDVRFVLHEIPEYALDSADFSNPNVLNLMSYNVQLLPLFIGGFSNNLRAGYIPDKMNPFQDVVIIQEAFDPVARIPELTPGMQAQGFNYNSGILNNYFPFNGGVIIYSRWPIETTAEYDFALCGPNSGDCFANKGIKYVRINKLGKKYHVFGTHLDAGSGPDDLAAKNLQFAEMRDFIAAQNIPANEPVIYGGDFNVSPISSNNLYANMLDSLHPILPDYMGFHCSTMALDTGKIIDNCWADPRYLLPLEAENEIINLRSIEDDMWDLSELSDHRTCLGRFVYPDIQFEKLDTALCLGDTLFLSVSSDIFLTYQWFHDGQAIPFATGPSFQVYFQDTTATGQYTCQVSYSITRGMLTDPVNHLFFSNGPQTHVANLELALANIELDMPCGVFVPEATFGQVSLYPNPAQNHLTLKLEHLPGRSDLTLRDFSGHVFLRKRGIQMKTELSLAGIPTGLYLLQL